jgi:anti-sigma-K factor RskA
MTDHERWEDAAGSYVLNALTDDERVEYEAHLGSCPECRAEVSELRIAAEALPVSPPPMVPPPALKARIMAEVEREAALLASAGKPDRAAAPTKPERRRRFFGGGALALPRPAFAALACAMLLVGLGVGGLLFGGGAGDTSSYRFASTLPQTTAKLEVSGDSATLEANGLPPAPAGKTYMVWLVRDGETAPQPTSALFTPRSDGSATASVSGDMQDVKSVLVNTEPTGGSMEPTSKPVLTATLT